jgi:predicted transcriptional regulator
MSPWEIVESPGQRVSSVEDCTGVECPTELNPIAQRLLRIHALQDELTSSPYSHDIIELAIATVISLPISQQDETALVWLLIVGPPSSDKTSSVLLLKTASGIYYVDSVTENFLASGYRDQKGNRAPDLLKELDGKCLFIKELSTVFSMKSEKVRKFLGDLQAIFDREYHKLTGTLGKVGGQAAFSIVACVTPSALVEHHEYMAKIGSRFLMYQVPQLTEEERQTGLEILWDESETRKQRLGELRELVAAHAKDLMDSPTALEPETREQRQIINRLAELMAHGRTVLRGQQLVDPDTGEKKYEPEMVQREEPFRVQQQLRTLARALARVHVRSRITDHELELVRRVALGSLAADRARVLALVPDHPQGLTVETCATGIGKGKGRARQLLNELALVGLLAKRPRESTGGRPETVYQPAPKFADLLTRPFKPLDHLLDLSQPEDRMLGDFLHNSDASDIGRELDSGQSYEESPGGQKR